MSQKMLYDWRQPVTPRSLALWFLSTAAPAPLRTATLIGRAAIFAIEPAAMRVALGRLVRERMAVQPERGVYALGPAAAALHVRARGWTRAEERVRAWDGAWVVVLTHHLGRTDRSRLTVRERALRLAGLAAAGPGVWVRPDNLTVAVREEARGLGLEEQAIVMTACRAAPEQDAAFRALWPAAALETAYRYWLTEMAASTERLTNATAIDAARETYLLGQSVLRAINSDPMLPEELVDAALRARMVAAMKRYNAMALGWWDQVR
ncbi:hypothetical protein [Sphingomonas adhaesiva]|uniref:hypothetical protein n=1 Tax=Sphingomonas adhaesiva TaxID=28212 RepID=UPI002FF7DA9D